MSFGLVLVVLLAIPVLMVKRGYSRVGIGLVMLGACMAPGLLFGVFVVTQNQPSVAFALAAYLSLPFILVALLWLIASFLSSVGRKHGPIK